MACASQSMISANTCAFPCHRILKKYQKARTNTTGLFSVRASTDSEESDCNVEECAPDKEVGKVSMEWLAVEKTRVVGTFPPRKKGWTGYVEKDTAGQTNIYSVEPAVYIAESAISSGNAGTSSEGAENTAAIAAGLGLISLAAASSILLQVGKNSPPQIQTLEYSGPSLSYYINKFQPLESIEAFILPESQNPLAIPTEGEMQGIPQVPVESENQGETLHLNAST
ncbi:protein MAINTENANCE OF PSII UNDER HIGH LIGHT 1 [Magnolia sinica]|uniref:protein MAINTENANCE OF PSII UNDER HIGH LIGHT 1 n=1 Tax=Magnolia sinica TaxID=86752 RepID=UPI0026589C40|nr:protein MAINTENANCE OF PSII UNDER HIGH LIGHT 1 [Magnolia sinica]